MKTSKIASKVTDQLKHCLCVDVGRRLDEIMELLHINTPFFL